LAKIELYDSNGRHYYGKLKENGKIELYALLAIIGTASSKMIEG